MPKMRLCDAFKSEIHSEEECRKAALFIGFEFTEVVDDPKVFPRCYLEMISDPILQKVVKVVKYNKNHSQKRAVEDLSSEKNIGNEIRELRAICTIGNQGIKCHHIDFEL